MQELLVVDLQSKIKEANLKLPSQMGMGTDTNKICKI